MAVYGVNLIARLPVVAPDLAFRLFVRNPQVGDSSVPSHRLRSPLARFNRGQGTGARLDKLAWETVMLPAAATRFRQHLVHSLYFAAPVYSPVPVVVTVHDLIPLVLNGYHRGLASRIYARLMEVTVHRAAAILTVSEHARRDILRILRVPEDRVFVALEAASPKLTWAADPVREAEVRARYALPERYILYLGSAEKRKNLEMLVRSWLSVARQMGDREVRLVVVTRFPPPDALYPDIPALVRAFGPQSGIQFVDGVDEEDKPATYRMALAFCFPSTYEGFGLPPLEAMAAGVPVIAANATSLPEVVGDAGILLPPADPAAWAETMLRLVDSPSERKEWQRRGSLRAGQFSWDDTARRTADVYRLVLGR